MSQPSYTPQQQRQAEIALLLTTTIWGSTFILIRNILPAVGPFTLLALRFVIGFAALFFLFFGRMRQITRTDVKAGFILGLLFFAGNAFQTSGLQYTSAGVSGFITALSVVMVPPFALIILRQRPTKGAVIGIASTVQQGRNNRLDSRTPVKGLYHCGDDSGAPLWGVGTELAARSGNSCARLILEER